MLRRRTHRIAIALALAAALLAPAASPAVQLHGTAQASSWPLKLDALRTWARLWLGLPSVPGHQKSASDAGLHIDPDGLQAPNSPAGANSDAGSHIDPNG